MPSSNDQIDEVYRIVYVSTATSSLELDELKALERVASRNNAELGVTGLLTYCDNKFMQFLEGEQADVEEIFSVIKRDSRHYSIDILRQGMIPYRQFVGWSMRYADIHDIHESKGYVYDKLFDVQAEVTSILDHATESLKLLLAFKNSCPNLI